MAKDLAELNTLIVGATFAGIGLACELQRSEPAGHFLFIDREITVGHEFAYAFKHGFDWNDTVIEHESAAEVRSAFISRNILSEEGRVHLPGMTPVLYRLLRDRGLPIRFMTDVVDIRQNNEQSGYIVTLFDGSGLRELAVKEIIDTTSDCRTCTPWQPLHGKRINALLHAKRNKDGSVVSDAMNCYGGKMQFVSDHYSFERGRFDSEAFLSIPLAPGDGWLEGRRSIHQFWANRPDELQGWTLAVVADQFDFEPSKGPHERESDWIWLPSAAYDNPLAAMNEAIAWLKGRVVV
ncbi:hypothetical protein [Paenibacillus chungangensis]|uniref:Uncharacterized protein n=1 Tax=Paenibacillus chungangensis TaxID=696535 RepID=A0ABW3HWT8_9BACL